MCVCVLTQAATLLGIGLQNKSIDDIEKELKLEGRQLLANFNKLLRKYSLNRVPV